MSVWRRMQAVFTGKVNAALDRVENPVETLAIAYQKQVDSLEEVHRGVAEVLTAEKRLELEVQQLRAAGERHHAAAAQAVLRDDAANARQALEREAFSTAQREHLLDEIVQVQAQRVALEQLAEQLRRRVELFRTQKLALAARYAAARATTTAGESVTGLSDEMRDVSAMVERAREQALTMQARADALTHLSNAEMTSEPSRTDEAWVSAQLKALRESEHPALGE